MKENYVRKGFDSFWADETEQDLPPNGSYWYIGPGTQFFNVFPLFHTAAFYNGFRKDLQTRALILARDSYVGAQHNGTIFWSSDINGNWDTLKRQVPTGINFVASGMPYWSTDIGGWQYLPASHKPDKTPLLDPSDARENVGNYDDYPELYVRWFEYGAFQPNFRSHGSRPQNEVWSYGKQAEPILAKYLRLRYQLMPYLYSLGHMSHETGAPFMRGLFMDFGADPNVANIGDEYMFGPSLLVAPITDQGGHVKERLSAIRHRLVQLLDQRARAWWPDPHCRCADRHDSSVRSGRFDPSVGRASGEHERYAADRHAPSLSRSR